ncbi:hypothetical protein [Streptococcus thoraltensis]|uniref:hypothetical protein n=1 Tax=Streptococcus thoraltensis TaxID=55085 RepID=UPI000363628E|nr:hypothetical protein [Streptococcus thoraltensis]MDY4762247.1 hypothetical protein [Streptococcus thoraltensis]
MSREYLAYLSAAIFILYGLMAAKWIFVFLGAVFIIIGIADRLQHKNKIGK